MTLFLYRVGGIVMDKNKKELIKIIADLLHEKAQLTDDFDIENLVKRLNGLLVYTVKTDVDASIQIGTSEDEYKFVITCRDDMAPKRQRFSIAHELGHLFLHMLNKKPEDVTNLVYNRERTGSQTEVEANEFAAALLMPEEKFLKVAEENCINDIYDVSRIAEKFLVSEQACDIRGRVLGIWN